MGYLDKVQYKAYESLEKLMDDYTRDVNETHMAAILGGANFINNIFEKMYKQYNYKIGCIEIGIDEYDDYRRDYYLDVDLENKICIDRAICTYEDSSYYGKPYLFDGVVYVNSKCDKSILDSFIEYEGCKKIILFDICKNVNSRSEKISSKTLVIEINDTKEKIANAIEEISKLLEDTLLFKKII